MPGGGVIAGQCQDAAQGLKSAGRSRLYYGVLARIELVAAQQTRAGGDRSKELQEQVMRVAERLQRIISASKPAVTAVESNGHHTQT